MIRNQLRLTCLCFALAALGCGDKKNPVLATVGGVEVKQAEFDAYLSLKHIPKKDEKRREAALDEYLKRKAIALGIEKEKKLDADLIAAEIEEFKKEMLISRYFEKHLEEGIDDKAVEEAYSGDSAKYEEKRVHVAHILVRTERRMSEEQKKAKLTTAQEIHGKLSSGASFEDLAREHSEDKISGSKGGDLGFIKEGTIDARFSERAFKTKAGTFTEPFETPFGYHIVKVIEEPKTVRRALTQVSGEIRYRLRQEAKKKEHERLEALMPIQKKKPYVLKEGEEEKAAPPSPLKRTGGLAEDGGDEEPSRVTAPEPAGLEPSGAVEAAAPSEMPKAPANEAQKPGATKPLPERPRAPAAPAPAPAPAP